MYISIQNRIRSMILVYLKENVLFILGLLNFSDDLILIIILYTLLQVYLLLLIYY